MTIRVLHSRGCGSTPRALERLRAAIAELEIDATVETRVVTERNDVAELRYFGSPTIQIDGIDIDPTYAGRTDFGGG